MQVIDRKQAADMLNVSIRTIDRYIQKGTLQKEEINGRIFIRAKDVKPLLDRKKLQEQYLSEVESLEPRFTPKTQENSPAESGGEPIETRYTDDNQGYSSSQDDDSGIYKKLYEETQAELKTKQERLEGANYRVGQLEGLLKESVPLIEYRKVMALEQKKQQELEDILNTFEKDNERLNQTVESKATELKQISEKLQIERFNKKVFIVILIILFLLQPLWLIFPG
jgi:DNA-binding transcriptional MerR regulator